MATQLEYVRALPDAALDLLPDYLVHEQVGSKYAPPLLEDDEEIEGPIRTLAAGEGVEVAMGQLDAEGAVAQGSSSVGFEANRDLDLDALAGSAVAFDPRSV